MDNDVPAQPENAERLGWFLSWLKDVFLPAHKSPVDQQLEEFSDALDRIPDLDQSVRRTLASTLTNEARIGNAKIQDKNKIQQILKNQTLPATESGTSMPWSKISDNEAKIISRMIEGLKIQDFSEKSIKHWSLFFADVFDKAFITSRRGHIAVVYNTCSLSLKNRLMSLDAGKDASDESYTFLNLLQLITTIVHSPDSRDQAMMTLHSGITQSSTESLQAFLQGFNELGEEAFGPSSNWTMSQASLIMKKICEGLKAVELSRLAASIVITTPFNWSNVCDSIKQLQQRTSNTHPQQNVHAIAVPQREKKTISCYRCGLNHLLKDCRALVCKYCGEGHKHCSRYGERTYCSTCRSKFHNKEGHFWYAPDAVKPRKADINVIEATSFLEGAVSMDMENSGENFINTKLLVDTGTLIPSGVGISEQFFIDKLGGKVGKLVLSDLNSANGASSNLMMKTVGQLKVNLRFESLSKIFSGSAVILRDLSLPVIIGINFLKSNSLSPV